MRGLNANTNLILLFLWLKCLWQRNVRNITSSSNTIAGSCRLSITQSSIIWNMSMQRSWQRIIPLEPLRYCTFNSHLNIHTMNIFNLYDRDNIDIYQFIKHHKHLLENLFFFLYNLNFILRIYMRLRVEDVKLTSTEIFHLIIGIEMATGRHEVKVWRGTFNCLANFP